MYYTDLRWADLEGIGIKQILLIEGKPDDLRRSKQDLFLRPLAANTIEHHAEPESQTKGRTLLAGYSFSWALRTGRFAFSPVLRSPLRDPTVLDAQRDVHHDATPPAAAPPLLRLTRGPVAVAHHQRRFGRSKAAHHEGMLQGHCEAHGQARVLRRYVSSAIP